VSDLYEVRLLGFPLRLHALALEHHEELVREFQLLALDPGSAHSVPRRLVDLVAELTAAYGAFTDTANADRDAAAARGEERVDLTYVVPASAAAAAAQLGRMLDEADEFCRDGDRLLTLASSPETAALRHWQLSEFAAQVEGAEPTPWDVWAARHPVPVG
jgi:hypothetical protein